MSKDTEVQQLIINKLTKEQYNSIEEKSLTEIYDITDDAHFTESEISSLLETKQNKLTAGNNISFSGDTISATDTKYTAGNGINISEDNVISSTQNSAEWGNITGTLTEQTDLQEVLDTKVNKEVGKSLISDTEIKRLATLENYNDTEVKSNISELQSSVTSLQETKQDKLTAGSGIQISDNTISATISSINWGNIEGDINSQTDLKSKLNTKVDKVSGKSLISDTEITRLSTVKNYDDTEIKGDISELQSSKQDKLTAGENITISGNTISNKIKPDAKTIIQNSDGTLTSIGNKTKSNDIKIDWIGTKTEYENGISDGSIQPDWFCYITDDEQTVDFSLYAVKTEVNQALEKKADKTSVQDSLNKRANIDLDNLSEAGKKVIKDNSGSSFSLFDFKLTDHILTGDEAVGWALQGSLVTNTYPDAVAKIKELYQAGEETTYREITCKRSQDGRYIADITQKEAIEALFTSTGVADFYILDSSNNQFYLPKSKWFKQLTTDTSLVNNYNEDGLPNLKKDATGSPEISVWSPGSNIEHWQGLIGKYPTTPKYNPNGGGYGQFQELLFDASKYNSKYGNSENVQPPSSNKLLYYRVGNTIINEAQIDVGNILSELQLKMDVTHSNDTKPYIVETYQNGTSWYRKWSDGFIMQGGYYSTIGSNETISFIKIFNNNPLHINLNVITTSGSGATDNLTSIYSYSNTGFTKHVFFPMFWTAYGY